MDVRAREFAHEFDCMWLHGRVQTLEKHAVNTLVRFPYSFLVDHKYVKIVLNLGGFVAYLK